MPKEYRCFLVNYYDIQFISFQNSYLCGTEILYWESVIGDCSCQTESYSEGQYNDSCFPTSENKWLEWKIGIMFNGKSLTFLPEGGASPNDRGPSRI